MPLSYEATGTNESSSSASVGGSSSGYDKFGVKKVENGHYSKITDSVWNFIFITKKNLKISYFITVFFLF